jgi:hypothetical protein
MKIFAIWIEIVALGTSPFGAFHRCLSSSLLISLAIRHCRTVESFNSSFSSLRHYLTF